MAERLTTILFLNTKENAKEIYLDFCSKLGRDNIIVVDKTGNISLEDLGNIKERNFLNACNNTLKEDLALLFEKHILCEYVFFATGETKINRSFKKNVLQAIDSGRKIYPLNNSIATRWAIKDNIKDTSFFNSMIYSYIFKLDAITNMSFRDICDGSTHTMMVINAINNEKIINPIKGAYCDYSESIESKKLYGNKKWYLEATEKQFLPLLKDCDGIEDYTKLLIISELEKVFRANKGGADLEVLTDVEKNKFFLLVGEVVKAFGIEKLLTAVKEEKVRINTELLYTFLSCANDLKPIDYTIVSDKNKKRPLFISILDINIPIYNNKIIVDAINVKNGKIFFDIRYGNYLIEQKHPNSLFARVNGKLCNIAYNNIYSLKKYFSVPVAKSVSGTLIIPEDIEDSSMDIEFGLKIKDEFYPLNTISFKPSARINTNNNNSYWISHGLLFYRKGKHIFIERNSSRKHLKFEANLLKSMVCESIGNAERGKALGVRLLYWITRPYYRKQKIWVYFDKLYKAGDNGEFLVRYAQTLKDGIKHYYYINKDSYEVNRLKELGVKLAYYGTIRQKLLTLNAENIVATHPDIPSFCGLKDTEQKNSLMDLYNANIICIAHGLTVQKNADYQNRLYDNTMFYTTSSKYEAEHIKRDIYGYSDDEIALTGLARFDGNINNDKRQILITPTWRRSASGSSQLNMAKGYNTEFKHTNYFKVYNELINDKRLIEKAKSTGYKLLFLIHPAMSAQIDDYTKNDSVEIIAAADNISYPEILGESSLMVTDYSGIQYDFAYMRKPIVYYHSKMIPMRFEEGALKFESMGFGPICKDHMTLVDTLIEYMDHNCIMEEEYKKRADDFFAFDDLNNCKRIYKAIADFTKKRN